MITADQPPILMEEAASAAFWQRFPEVDRPGPQEREAASIMVRAMSVADASTRLELFRQARAKLLQPTRFRGMVVCSEAGELAQLERLQEAEALAAECLQLRPDDPKALLLSAGVKMERRDPSDGVRELIAAIARQPNIAASLPPEMIDSVARKLAYVGKSDLGAELVQVLAGTNWGRDDPQRASSLAMFVITRLLEQDKRSEAVQLLPRVLDPREGMHLVLNRAYDPIREDIEAWAGGTLNLQRDAFVAATEGAFSIKPDLPHRIAYAEALRVAGRPDEAIDVLAAVVRRPDQWDESDAFYFHLSGAAIKLAVALRQLGRNAEATEGLAEAERLLRARSPSYALNVVPNLARFYLRDRDPDRALALLAARTPNADQVEGPGALSHFQALRLCALKMKGADVSSETATFQQLHAGNRLAMQTFAACMNNAALAKPIVLERLEDQDRRNTMLAAAHALQSGLSSYDIAVEMELLAPVLDDPDVRQALARWKRTPADSYGPAASLWSVKEPRLDGVAARP